MSEQILANKQIKSGDLPVVSLCATLRTTGRAACYSTQDGIGWSEIDTVDDDLGRSAAGGVARAGFERMVCLGTVGAVAARRSRASLATAATVASVLPEPDCFAKIPRIPLSREDQS
jgi:hypothetical protein